MLKEKETEGKVGKRWGVERIQKFSCIGMVEGNKEEEKEERKNKINVSPCYKSLKYKDPWYQTFVSTANIFPSTVSIILACEL